MLKFNYLLHDKYIKQLEALMDDKEKEIMTV